MSSKIDRKFSIGVTGSGSLIGQAIIKSIIRSELRKAVTLTGFDYFEKTVGSFWCDINCILPDILLDEITEEQWLASVLKGIEANGVDLLFVGIDFELPLFAKFKKEIESRTGAVVMVSAQEVISIADDKYLTYKFLKENNLFFPETWLPNQIDLNTVKFPVIVKPRRGARSIGVEKVMNKEELAVAIQHTENPVIQEYIGSPKNEFTCGVIFMEGGLKKSIVLNRSLKDGNTFISNFSHDYPQSITRYLKDVCDLLNPYGACNFQLRIDNDDTPKIFEINARHSGTTYIRSLFGFKEIEYIIYHVLYGKEQHFKLQEGTVVRYFDEFFFN